MNCKPGDLAIVVRTRGTPEMLGRIVTVLRPLAYGEVFKTDRGPLRWVGPTEGLWVVSSNHQMPWRTKRRGLCLCMERPYSDEALRPINPGDLVEDENQENKLKEPA